jgi:inner membrane protein
MCTSFAHAAVGLLAIRMFYGRPAPLRLWVLGAGCAALPDIDAGLHFYGVAYESAWGHRGMMHSLFFAAIVGCLVSWLALRHPPTLRAIAWWKHAAIFGLITASHGVLDLLTDGGLGIALLAPFSNERFFAPWNPFPVPMMGVTNLFTRYMAEVLLTEALLVVLPCAAMVAAAEVLARVGPRPLRPALSGGLLVSPERRDPAAIAPQPNRAEGRW